MFLSVNGTAQSYGTARRTMRDLLVRSGACAGGLADGVVALGDVRRPAGRVGIRRARGSQVAVELVQVPADRVPAVAAAEHLAQRLGLAESRGGTVHVADRHSAAQ